VRPVLVVVGGVDTQDSVEVSASDDEDAIEAVAADSPHPALGERVRLRRSDGSPDHLDPLGAEDFVEVAAELRVAVVDQQSVAAPLLAQLRDEFLLGDPRPVGVLRAGDELRAGASLAR
jgi:hypothetical protein